jgi:deferrochelatase/peroxidase EfeB
VTKSDVGSGRRLIDEENTRCPRCVRDLMIRLDAQRQETCQKVVVRMVERCCEQWKVECAVEDGVEEHAND